MPNTINSLNYGNNTYTFTLPYGVCSTAAGTAAKTVTVDNFSLETGATVVVKFTYANTAASPTLNVNSTGAKPIYRYGTTAASTGTTTTGWVAGAVQMFTYDGTGWIRDYWNNTTYNLSSFGVTATAAELNKLDGCTATVTELNYVDGVTSKIQTQLNGKQATVTGGASTITSSNLTASRALISNGSGKVAVSAVTSTELGYLDGVTSKIQTQLNNKAPKYTYGQTEMVPGASTLATGTLYFMYESTNGDACLIAGTQILMSDFSLKPIEFVQAGDMIKSWDLEEEDYIDVKVLGVYQTGVAKDWLVHSFDNGKSLTIYQSHNIFCKENNSIKKSVYWEENETAISMDGLDTKYCDVVEQTTGLEVGRYTMLTENNLYFANGILCGHHPRAKLRFYNDGILKASEEELSQYEKTYNIYASMNGQNNPEYRKQAEGLRSAIFEAKDRIKNKKFEFAKDGKERDKINKHKKENSQKINDIKQHRKKCKADINNITDEITQMRIELNKLKEQFGVSTDSIYECFAKAYKLDMDYLKTKGNNKTKE